MKFERSAIAAASTTSSASATRKSTAKQHSLEDALDDVLAGRAVRVAATEAVGCRIGRLNRNSPKGDVTYSNQISRILQAHCVQLPSSGRDRSLSDDVV